MNNEVFTIACERASKEVLSLILDGYMLIYQVCFYESQTALMKLHHTKNENQIKVRVCGRSWELWKNNKLVKKEYV